MRILSISIGINDGNDHESYHWLPHFQWNNQKVHNMTVKGISIGWGVFMFGAGLTVAPKSSKGR